MKENALPPQPLGLAFGETSLSDEEDVDDSTSAPGLGVGLGVIGSTGSAVEEFVLNEAETVLSRDSTSWADKR